MINNIKNHYHAKRLSISILNNYSNNNSNTNINIITNHKTHNTMEQRVKNAIKVFIKAIDNRTLAKGNCKACAVGNLVAHGLGAKVYSCNGIFFSENRFVHMWSDLFMTVDGKQSINTDALEFGGVKEAISSTEFTWEELAKIEFAFETNTDIEDYAYRHHTDEEILDDQIKGLEAVIEVMLSFSNDTQTDVKEVFTNKVNKS